MNKKHIVLIVLALFVFSCRKDHSDIQYPIPPIVPIVPPVVPNGTNVYVTIDQSRPGIEVPANFQGLSFETQILTADPGFLEAHNTVLIQLIKNLGPGILRMGGGTSDEVYWSENVEVPASVTDSLTRTDIDRLSAFSKAIGWPVLFGLNLGINDATAATSEAMYVRNSLGDNLYAFQSGNEPDVFNYGMRPPAYNYTNYQTDWENYLSAVRSKIPEAEFAGPDVAYNSTWIVYFAAGENKNVKLFDGHYYLTGPATDASINYHTILAYSTKLSTYLQTLKIQSDQYKIPYRVTESNNVYGGGKRGVSDVFASTLWTLETMWVIAEKNGAGVNFHDGQGLFYSPITIQNTTAAPGAEYYAMLAFKYASDGGTVFPANIDNPENCSAHVCVKADNSYVFTLINRSDTANYSFNIALNKAAASVQIARLTAPSITAQTGITFGGAAVNADGTFNVKTLEQQTMQGNKLLVNVASGSAAIVTVK